MTETKFTIRPYDRSASVKRPRHIEPPMAVPKDAEGWKWLDWMRSGMNEMRKTLDNNAAIANRLNDPVISRSMLTIHRALLRIDRRTFAPTVDRVFRQVKDAEGETP